MKRYLLQYMDAIAPAAAGLLVLGCRALFARKDEGEKGGSLGKWGRIGIGLVIAGGVVAVVRVVMVLMGS